MNEIRFFVIGVPAPQGSKRHVGRGILVESSKRVAPWRQAVEAAARGHGGRILGPVAVRLVFRLPRPKGHYRTGRNSNLLRNSAPTWPTSLAHGDIDKLTRSTLDGLVCAEAIEDDSQVVILRAAKAYAHQAGEPGCLVTITPAEGAQ